MTNNNKKEKVPQAEIATVRVGYLEFEGLYCSELDEFGVAVPQIVEIFSVPRNRSLKQLNALWGTDFQPRQWRTTLNSKAVSVLLLDNCKTLVHKLALKGNKKALEIWNELEPTLAILEKSYPKTRKSRGHIYLFEGINILKLGYSTNVMQRLKTLSRWEGELEIVAQVKGTIEKEKLLHSLLHKTGDYFGDEWYPASRKHEILNLMDISLKNSTLVKEIP